MAVHQLKDGRWICQWRDGGRILREYCGRGVEGELRAWRKHEALGLQAYTRRESPETAPRLFEELAQGYLNAMRGVMQPSTMERIISKLVGVILPSIGGADPYRLTPERMDRYVNERLNEGRKRTTVHRELSDIQAILNWAVSRSLISRNPLLGYKKPSRDDEIIQPPTQKELEAILRNSPPHLVRALAISYYTGLRPGRQELFSLRWTDVDPDLRLILVRSARKGGLRARMVPIHENFFPALDAWRRADDSPDGHIITYRGKPVHSIKTAYGRAKKKAGITRRLPPYAFRHAFATYVLGQGGDLKATSEILGHSRPDTTTRIYQHTDLTLQRQSVNKLPPLALEHYTNV